MGVFSTPVRVLAPAPPGEQNPDTGRPAEAEPEDVLFDGFAFVDDAGSARDLDRWGSAEASGGALVIFRDPMDVVRARVGHVLEAEVLPDTFLRGTITVVRLAMKTVQVAWQTELPEPPHRLV